MRAIPGSFQAASQVSQVAVDENACVYSYNVVIYPEFCKELGKKSSEHRMNTGVQSFFEMHRSVVFFTHF